MFIVMKEYVPQQCGSLLVFQLFLHNNGAQWQREFNCMENASSYENCWS